MQLPLLRLLFHNPCLPPMRTSYLETPKGHRFMARFAKARAISSPFPSCSFLFLLDFIAFSYFPSLSSLLEARPMDDV